MIAPGAQPTAAARLELGPVSPRLFGQLVRLHRAVFPPEQVAATIYAGRGVARYLASLVAYPVFQPEHLFWGARRGRKLIAYAHFRALPDSWHLNNIAVLPGCQGQGIGSRLWRQFVESARARGFSALSLDVESDNQPAIDWYRRQGLDVTGAVWRYEKRLRGLPAAQGAQQQPLRLAGWDQAEAWQAAYGFSQFQIHGPGQTWTIGRIGDHTFRSSQPLPEAVESALAQIDPSRRLVIISGEPLNDPDVSMLGKSLRMRGALP